MRKNGWFTAGTVSFITENERKDGKGSYLSVYIRFGTEKGQVTKTKVWSQNYLSDEQGVRVLDVSGAWVAIEVGAELTAYGDITTYTDKASGNQVVSYIMTETAGLTSRVSAEESLNA
jgi:hypothetical protein